MSSALLPILICLTAIGFGSLMDAAIKAVVANGLSVLAVLFWRFAIAGVVMAVAFVALRQKPLGWPALRFHTLRGLIHATMAALFFYGISQIPLAEATSLGFTAVLMAGPLERLFLAAPLRPMAVWAALVGFAGVLTIALGDSGTPGTVPQGDVVLGRAACLGAALLYALTLIMLRARARADGAFAIALMSNVVPALWLAAPSLLLVPQPSLEDAPVLVGLAIMGSGVWILMTLAYARAPAQRLAPLEYSSLLWSALFGWAFFSEWPGPNLWLGAALIIAACLLTLMPERAAKQA